MKGKSAIFILYQSNLQRMRMNIAKELLQEQVIFVKLKA